MASIAKCRDKFQVRVRRKGLPTLTKTFMRMSDAREWANLQERQIDRGELGLDRKVLETVSLADLITRYRDEIVPTKKGREIETIILNAFLRHPICKKVLADVTTSDFASYRDERLKMITAKSLKRQLSPIGNMFEVARTDWKLPLKNPLSDLNLKANDNRRERRLRVGEFERLLKAGRKTRNPLLIPIVRLALETGMRRGEILALQKRDLDLPRHSLIIRQSKNGYSRNIPLSNEAVAILKGVMGKGERVFPMTPIALRLAWDRLVERAKINNLHFHDLRHEAISRFFELGLTVPEVASISGHRDMRMLFRYAHANHQSIRAKLAGSTQQ